MNFFRMARIAVFVGTVFTTLTTQSLLVPSHAHAKTLHARVVEAPSSLDWTGQATIVDARIIMNICEGLFGYEYTSDKSNKNFTQKLVPLIAASVKKSKDYKEYTFTIRSDAKWSDGRAIYAKDFLDSWQRVLSPQSTSIYSYYLFDIVNAYEYSTKKITSFDDVGIKAVNDRTLVVKFKRSQKNWEVNTAFWPLYPIRKDLVEKYGNDWWRAGILVSSGPFIFHSYEPGKKAVLKRNPHYGKTKSNIDLVEIDFINNQEDALKKYKENFYPYLANVPKELESSQEYFVTNMLRHHVLTLNTERFPFNNKQFRLAFLSAINRTEIIPEKNQHFTAAKTLIPPALFSNKEDLSVPYDPKKAKEYLEKSGVVLNKTFKLMLIVNLTEPFYTVAKKIAAQVEKNLGINVEISAMNAQDFETFGNLGEYNVMMPSWTNKVRSPQDFLYPYSGYSPSNRTHYKNSEFENLVDNGEFKKAQLLISHEEAVVQPLFFENKGFLAHPTIKNLVFDHHGLPLYKDVILSEATR